MGGAVEAEAMLKIPQATALRPSPNHLLGSGKRGDARLRKASFLSLLKVYTSSGGCRFYLISLP